MMGRVMMVDVERVRRRDGSLDQLMLCQRLRCGRDTKLRDRGGLNLIGWLTLEEWVSREEEVAVAAAVEAFVVVAAVADVRVGDFALD